MLIQAAFETAVHEQPVPVVTVIHAPVTAAA
jgi:hypothetical protein